MKNTYLSFKEKIIVFESHSYVVYTTSYFLNYDYNEMPVLTSEGLMYIKKMFLL